MINEANERRLRCPGGKNKVSKRANICDDGNYDATLLDLMNIQQAIMQYMVFNQWLQINNEGWNVWDDNKNSASSKCMKVISVPTTFTSQNYWKSVLVPRMNGPICVSRNNRKNDNRKIFLGK